MLARLQSKGFAFLLLVHLSAQQFQQFMTGFGNILQRQEQVLEGVSQAFSSSAGSASASVAKSLESASKILKTPEPFDACDSLSWVSWRHSFLNWFSYADGRLLESIEQIEKLTPSEGIETVDWSQTEWDLARKLYAILTSWGSTSVEQVRF